MVPAPALEGREVAVNGALLTGDTENSFLANQSGHRQKSPRPVPGDLGRKEEEAHAPLAATQTAVGQQGDLTGHPQGRPQGRQRNRAGGRAGSSGGIQPEVVTRHHQA